MSAKPSLWQARWQIDPHLATATHDSGLQVHLHEGKGVASNGETVVRAWIPQHGAHNAAAMLQRLVREGAALLVDPHARGWRG